MKNEKGFTLIEMMVVLLVISVLLIITVPNVTQHNSNINKKGCEALLKMIDGQVQAYRIDTGAPPADITALVTANYLKAEATKCPDGRGITLTADGASAD